MAGVPSPVIRVLPLALTLVAAHTCSSFASQVSRLAFASSGGMVSTGSFRLSTTVGEAGLVSPLVSGGSFILGVGHQVPDRGGASSVDETTAEWANLLATSQPNPFRQSTTISYSLSKPGRLRLSVYDVTGSRVATLINDAKPAGHHAVIWNGQSDSGSQVPSGLYFYRLEAGGMRQTKRVMRLR